jgi:hypothetical protein
VLISALGLSLADFFARSVTDSRRDPAATSRWAPSGRFEIVLYCRQALYTRYLRAAGIARIAE